MDVLGEVAFNLTEPQWHDKCGAMTPRYKNGDCIPCHHVTVAAWAVAHPDRSDPHKWCKKCESFTEWSKNGKCVPCARAYGSKYRAEHSAERQSYMAQCTQGSGQTSCDPALPRSHPMGATIDHLIPLSRGGPDTPDNVSAAHWQCNVRRQNKPLGDLENHAKGI